MCYYNSVKIKNNTLVKLLNVERSLDNLTFDFPVQTGFEYPQWPVIRAMDNCAWEAVPMEWGFLPSHVWDREGVERFRNGYTDNSGKFKPPYTTLNARGEDVLSSKSIYRDAALNRRCLVLSTGFYEWRHVHQLGKKGLPLKTAVKYPYHISLKDGSYFYMAGIWQPWKDRKTGEYFETFAIITTQANSLMAQIHNSKNRMPVIMLEDVASEWISDLSEDRISELASYQLPAQAMRAHTIARDFLQLSEPSDHFIYETLPDVETYS